MASSLVLTLIGSDRPGLVERLSETIAAHEGSWLEGRMSHLAGRFAGILRVSVPEARIDALIEALAELESDGLKVVSERGGEQAPAFHPVTLELVGADHAGIVRDVAAALARDRVNVEELNTECIDAPMSGQKMFKATARLHLPPEVSLEELRGELEGVAHDLMVDVTLGEPATVDHD